MSKQEKLREVVFDLRDLVCEFMDIEQYKDSEMLHEALRLVNNVLRDYQIHSRQHD